MKNIEYHTFSCGCKVKILNPEIKECDGLPSIELDYYNLPYCRDTWDLLSTGKTKGVFQVEKSLGKHWCKEIKPLNITDLSALIALIRPGCLEGLVDGKSLTQHYADSKNGKSEKLQIHPALDIILGETQNILVFQEQAILIAQEIAGFNGAQADTLRRGIGHKDPAVLFGLEKEFIEGCLQTGKVSESDARIIFDLIKKGCRYSFNACLSPSTVVETQNGFKTLDELKIGEKILCPTENGDKFVEVLNFFESGEKDLFEIGLYSGESIVCSMDHNFLCSDGKKYPAHRFIYEKLKLVRRNNEEGMVASVEYLGKMRSIDIEVDSKEHLFYGNGVATSNSHSCAYAEIGYYTSYAKYHVPLHFFASYIAHAKDKQDQYKEIKELINDAKQSGIQIESPNLCYINNTGDLSIQDQKILYGLIDIKGIGRANIEKLYENVKNLEESLGNIKTWSWEDLLFNMDTTSTVMNNLILVGATNGNKPRKQKSFEFSIYNKLTQREKDWARQNYRNFESLGELLKKYSEVERKAGGPSNEARRGLIRDFSTNLISSPFKTKDHPDWIVANERELLGLPLTYNSIENKNIASDTSCLDFLNGKNLKKFNIIGEISDFNEYITKKGNYQGKPMGVFSLSDSTDSIKCIIFANSYPEYSDLLFENNTVFVTGSRSRFDTSTLIIDKMEQI